jgi:hypothetical protein
MTRQTDTPGWGGLYRQLLISESGIVIYEPLRWDVGLARVGQAVWVRELTVAVAAFSFDSPRAKCPSECYLREGN